MQHAPSHSRVTAETLALRFALAAIVRAAERVERGRPARRALAEAAEPLRGLLYGSDEPKPANA